MLAHQVRRRRSCLGKVTEDKKKGEALFKRQQPPKRTKLKMSPFPEVQGHTLKENRLSNLTEVRTSLKFAEDEIATAVTPTPTKAKKPKQMATVSPSLPFEEAHQQSRNGGVCDSSAAIKPSSLLELQRHMTPQVKKTSQLSAAASQDSGDEGQATKSIDPGASQQPSAGIRSMWDNVVSLLKVAVDFISTEEAIEDSSETPQAKKRGRCDDGCQSSLPPAKLPRCADTAGQTDSGEKRRRREPPQRRGSFGRDGGRSKRRMSFGGLRSVQRNTGSSGEGLSQLLSLEPIQEATDHATSPPSSSSSSSKTPCSLSHSPATILTHSFNQSLSIKSPPPPSFSNSKKVPLQGMVCSHKALLSSARRFQPTNDGLNSILDGSPVAFSNQKKKTKKVIHHTALRSFYGNSVDSPNLNGGPPSTNQFDMKSSQFAPPSPPPPPPLPPSHVPLPPPTPKLPSCSSSQDDGCDGNSSTNPQSRDVLLKMQHRLRSRIKKCGGGIDKDARRLGAVSTPGGTSVIKIDIKIRQWAEIQAHSRKITLRQFLEMADRKKEEIEQTLRALQSSVPQEWAAITATVELLQEAFQWFPGGSKEMKDTLPLYKRLEKKIEILNEFVQITSEMAGARVVCVDDAAPHSSSALPSLLSHTREEFDSKHRHWGSVLLNGASSWSELGLPVCRTRLATACYHLCSLADKHIALSLQEASKITGILVSIKCVRTTQLKEKLKESLVFLLEARPYFTSDATIPECDCVTCSSSGGAGEMEEVTQWRDKYCQDELLSMAAQILLAYLKISSQQFDGFVCRSTRQEVCEHFEGVLKMLGLVKSLVSSSLSSLLLPPGDHQHGRKARSKGIIPHLPEPERLGAALYASCAGLIQHIVGQAQPFVSGLLSPSSKERTSKEVMLWMMFGCKFVNQTLEILGSEQADERGVASLLGDLQNMEELLPE